MLHRRHAPREDENSGRHFPPTRTGILLMTAKQSGSHMIEFQLRVWYSGCFYCPETIFMISELKPQSHVPSQS